MAEKTLYLATGLQSGGTTLVSWCFLQRPDLDGILDLPFDELVPLGAVASDFTWCKMTTASFRWQDVADYYAWQGYNVKPLMIVRDVRHAYSSMKSKAYGINGTTPEDPPLRLRLMRFLRDWREFQDRGWPILQYERLLERPDETLQACCRDLGLPWKQEMVTWPKPAGAICDASRGNTTFWSSFQEGGLLKAINKQQDPPSNLSRQEHAWLDATFEEFNQVNGYAVTLDLQEKPAGSGIPEPRFTGTGRDMLYRKNAELQQALDFAPIMRGRMLARIINALTYPGKTLRAIKAHRK